MPLPPDPHDDDVADPSAAPPPPPPPPPPPAAADPFTSVGEPGGARPEPPSSPAYAPPPPRPMVTTSASRVETKAPRPSLSSSPSSSPDQGHAPGRSRLGWMIAAVVAVIVAAGVVLATGGDDDDTPAPAADETPADAPVAGETPADEASAGEAPADEASAGEAPAEDGAPVDAAGDESPVEVADAFFAAAASGDCAGMVDRMTLESFSAEGLTPEQAIAECESDVAGGGTGLAGASFGEVTLVSEQGDQATVAVDVVLAGEQVHEEFPLRLIDGMWKLHLEASSQPQGG
jgi:hypothetical protein